MIRYCRRLVRSAAVILIAASLSFAVGCRHLPFSPRSPVTDGTAEYQRVRSKVNSNNIMALLSYAATGMPERQASWDSVLSYLTVFAHTVKATGKIAENYPVPASARELDFFKTFSSFYISDCKRSGRPVSAAKELYTKAVVELLVSISNTEYQRPREGR